MSRWCREVTEMRETDGNLETRFFHISKATAEWLLEHGTLAAIMVCPPEDYGFWAISAEGTLEADRWTGWDWMWDEFSSAGMNPSVYGL